MQLSTAKRSLIFVLSAGKSTFGLKHSVGRKEKRIMLYYFGLQNLNACTHFEVLS